MKNRLKNILAQNIIEYSIVLSLTVSAFIAIQTYVRRGIQVGIKASSDQLGEQEKGMPYADPREGVVQTSHSRSRTPAYSPSEIIRQTFEGGKQAKTTDDVKRSLGEYNSKSKDDGWYYIKENYKNNKWELRRKKKKD